MTMLCKLIDKYVVETLLCSGGGKMGIRGIHWRERAMMRWKVVTAMLLLALNNITYAQIADVTGIGEDSDSALRDAKRNAVEQVVGTYINSETLVSQASVVSDEIYAKSVGFITDVRVLDEGKRNGAYYVHAKIDVNTNPNSELMNRIEMVKALGDPRIGVVVTYYSDADNAAKEKYPLMCESAINSKLTELGFTHVVSSNMLLNDKEINRYTAIDTQKLLPDKNLDYLIICKLDLHTGNIVLPKYESMSTTGETFSTDLVRSLAEINVDIYKASTGEVLTSFNVESKAVQNSSNTSANASIKLVGADAAGKIKKALSKKAASVDNQLQLHVEATKYADVSEILQALKFLPGVSNVREENYNQGKSVITLATTLKPQTVFRLLKEKVSFKLFMKNVTANDMTITTK